MRKILLFATFFLLLLPAMMTEDAFTLSAQNMAYEDGSWWLPEVEVEGRAKEICSACGNYYYVDEAADHVCTRECEYCHQLVEYNSYYDHFQSHSQNSDGETYCAFCAILLVGDEIYTHNCQNTTIVGNGNNSGSEEYNISIGGNTGWEVEWHSIVTPSSPYKQFRESDVVISNQLLKEYVKQETRYDCVVTAMEYAAGILAPEKELSRDYFQYIYDTLYPMIHFYGLPSSTVDNYISLVFDCSSIDTYVQLKNAINNHHPVIGHINGTIITPFNPIEHMVLAVGYSINGFYEVICIDPGTGGYRTVSFSDFNGNIYELNQVNPNFR